MNELALFAGAGGSCLWAELVGVRTVAAVEVSPYRREVLLRRQVDGMLPMFPIWDNIRTFDGRPWRGVVDLVTGGFPCQPFSTAGKRRGKDDPKNLWPHTIRIIREVRPPVAFLENVPGLLALKYFGEVLGDLAEAGYDAEWMVLGADDLGATHRRKRLWILAYRNEERKPELSRMLADLRRWARDGGEELGNSMQQPRGKLRERKQATATDASAVGNSNLLGRENAPQRHEAPCFSCGPGQPWPPGPSNSDAWRAIITERPDLAPAVDAESPVRRVADGLAHRVDRLAALGDGWVPVVAAAAFWTLARRARLVE